MKIKYLPLIILVFICAIAAKGQPTDLLTSRETSYYTYLYKITEPQIIALNKKGLSIVDDSFFSELAFFYPTDSSAPNSMPHGTYLKVWAVQNELWAELLMISDLNIELLNNSSDLQILVRQKAGETVSAAQVELDGKKMKFDPITETYRHGGSNRQGLLKISYRDSQSFFVIERSGSNPKLRRAIRKVFYSVPIKYLTIPIEMVIRSPIDLVKTAIHPRRPQGVFYLLSKPPLDIYRSIRYLYPSGLVGKVYCIFDPSFCGREKFVTGYFILSKPIYKPGETVKWKAFLVKPNGRPYKKDLNLWLSKNSWSNDRSVLIEENVASKTGAYLGDLILSDSLNLQLDKDYSLYLTRGKYKNIVHTSFHHELYELKGIDLTASFAREYSSRGNSQEISISGKDINGLNLLDAEIELTLMAEQIDTIYQPTLIVPDVLWHHTQELDPIHETKITLPDSVFPLANLSYSAIVTLITSDREVVEKKITSHYSHLRSGIVADVKNDSIKFEYQENGQAIPKSGSLSSFDKNGSLIEEEETVTYPKTIKINPFVAYYGCTANSLKQIIKMEQWNSAVEILSNRTADTIEIQLSNPHNIPVNYTVYRKNKEIARGRSTSIDLRRRNTTKKNYFASIQYFWAGEKIEENYTIPLPSRRLHMRVFQPDQVYPGQANEISVLVSDHKDRPVKNVDVAAYAFTGKFKKYTPPSLTDQSKEYKDRILINTFSKANQLLSEQHEQINLNWQVWNAKMGLDSISYFNFLFPGGACFKSFSKTTDSTTQLAPFVVTNGEIIPVHIVYIDERPVYFSMAETVQRYSFQTLPGWHSVRLRTSHSTITIDSVFVEKSGKNIISIDPNFPNRNIYQVAAKAELNAREIRLAESFLINVKARTNDDHTFIHQGENIFWMNNSGRNWSDYTDSRIVGPLYKNSKATYTVSNSFDIDFDVESRYQYEFSDKVVKMKSYEKLLPSAQLHKYEKTVSIKDLAVSRAEISDYLLRQKKPADKGVYDFPKSTSEGYGKIQLLLDKSMRGRLSNLVVFWDTQPQFITAYPGTATLLHNFEPGDYTVYGVLDDDSFFECTATVLPNSSTYVAIDSTFIQTRSITSEAIRTRLKNIYEKDRYSIYGRKDELKEVQKEYYQSRRSATYGTTVSGVVTDAESGDAFPGVNVIIKGTNIGTVTDIDGFYELRLPDDSEYLVFVFIGYVTEEVLVGYRSQIDVHLTPDVKQLSEVIVVGYGVEHKMMVSGSVTTVGSDSFGGDVLTQLEGKIAGVASSSGQLVRIRGANSVGSNSNPLFVVNGVPYEGSETDIDPSMIDRIEILKGEEAVLIFGSKALNGAVIITTKRNSQGLFVSLAQPNATQQGFDQKTSLRNNFRDDAFWAPSLNTDKNGLAKFTVSFPDDVTSWKTFYLAHNGKKQSGQWQGEIKSYKPLMGTLSVPAFLVTGDSAYVIGKSLNYLADSVHASSLFSVDDKVVSETTGFIKSARIDSAMVTGTGIDSLKVIYTTKINGGYEDGELRKIPIYKKGTTETQSVFHALSEIDSIVPLAFSEKEGPVNFYARATAIDVLLDEIEHVQRYPYLCNEQAASKLLMLVSKQKIAKALGKPFQESNSIERLVKHLLQSINKELLWGWWKDNRTVPWITNHVIISLMEAEQLGYSVKLDKQALINQLIVEMDAANSNSKVQFIHSISLLGGKLDYPTEIDKIKKDPSLNFTDSLRLVSLKQQFNRSGYSIDSILLNKKVTTLGGVYWSNNSKSVEDNETLTTLLAYRILEREQGYDPLLDKTIDWLLQSRAGSYWTNTYLSTQILSTILPRLISQQKSLDPPSLTLSGSINTQINTFPFEGVFQIDDTVFISKKGLGTVYLTAYQTIFNDSPMPVEESFIINTKFEHGDNTLLAGNTESLIVNLTVKATSEYVMVEVPIPAGCSYNEKSKGSLESHREYFAEKVSIFFQTLPAGDYTLEVSLLPRFSGSYTLNPAKVELMYFPSFQGRNESKSVTISSVTKQP